MESQKEECVAREDDAMVVVAAAAVTLDSSPVQESPFSNFLNNLSPIKPMKAANAGQVFHGINSSPLVFSSPTVNLQSRSDHLKRSKMLESSKPEQSDDARKDDPADSSQKYMEFVAQSGNVLVGLNEEFTDSKDSLIPQSRSSSRIMDGFLADPAETDCANSTHLKDVHGDCPKSNSSFDCEGGSTNGFGEEAIDMLLFSPEQANQEAGNFLICDRPPKGSEEYHVAEPSCSVGYEVATIDLPKDDSKSQMDIGPDSDIKEGSHLYASSGQGQPLYDSLLNSEANEDHGEGASEGLIMLADTHHHEEMQHQPFLLRRCLRFDDVLLDVSSNSLGSPSSNINSPRSLTVVELEKLDFSGGNATYLKTPVNKLRSAVKPVIGKSSSMTTNKTSGTGLHLNGIIDASPTGAGTCNTSDVSTRSAHCAEPQNFTEAKELYVTPLDNRKTCLALADAEFIQTNPKRRRKASNTSVSNGCKRCSCRKSRCLKLYCDCFAAGLFCTEPCACQGCLNRCEEKEAVIAAREQIESRNPLAFAPKIVQSDKGQDATDGENENWSTPSSARHKKGCNCKRSMCQKKYCECYQSNVGCSDNCRCEGCLNVFGTKEDFLVARDIACRSVGAASLERNRNVKLSMAMTYSRDHLMPPTPAFQFSDNRKGLRRSRLATKCSSPNSSAKSGSAAGLTREMQFEGSQESPAFVSVTDLLDPNCGEKAPEFSPKHDSPGSLCHPTPLLSTLSTVISEAREPSSTSYPGGGHLPRSSLCERRSPDNSRQDHEPWIKIYELLSNDTPGVLKDASSPTRRVIVHSPSWKRVSSPHKQISEHCSSSSTALRSGGKFILKAVRSFPRLTPSSKSTDNACKSDGHHNSFPSST